MASLFIHVAIVDGVVHARLSGGDRGATATSADRHFDRSASYWRCVARCRSAPEMHRWRRVRAAPVCCSRHLGRCGSARRAACSVDRLTAGGTPSISHAAHRGRAGAGAPHRQLPYSSGCGAVGGARRSGPNGRIFGFETVLIPATQRLPPPRLSLAGFGDATVTEPVRASCGSGAPRRRAAAHQAGRNPIEAHAGLQPRSAQPAHRGRGAARDCVFRLRPGARPPWTVRRPRLWAWTKAAALPPPRPSVSGRLSARVSPPTRRRSCTSHFNWRIEEAVMKGRCRIILAWSALHAGDRRSRRSSPRSRAMPWSKNCLIALWSGSKRS